MKITVKLTADELQNVLDAAANEALDNGLLYDDNEDDMSCLFATVDAALTAMGIDIEEEVEEEEDEEEDEDPIYNMLYVLDDGRTAISFEDACFLMDMIKETGMERGLSDKESDEAARNIFIQIGKDYGIDVVEEDEEDEPEEEQEYPDNPVSRCVFIHEGKRAIKQSDADQIVQAMTEVVDAHLGFLPDEIKQKVRADMLLKVFEENGVEIVVKGE